MTSQLTEMGVSQVIISSTLMQAHAGENPKIQSMRSVWPASSFHGIKARSLLQGVRLLHLQDLQVTLCKEPRKHLTWWPCSCASEDSRARCFWSGLWWWQRPLVGFFSHRYHIIVLTLHYLTFIWNRLYSEDNGKAHNNEKLFCFWKTEMKTNDCCKELSSRPITAPITDYMIQRKKPPCVRAVM